jgi:hypothetical protein
MKNTLIKFLLFYLFCISFKSNGQVNFFDVTSYSIGVSWAPNIDPCDGYLVIRSIGVANNLPPNSNSTYSVGDQIGNSKVSYIGNQLNYIQTSVIASQSNFFQVYPFSWSNGLMIFWNSEFQSGTIVSLNNMIGNYYSNVDSTSDQFISQLQQRISQPHVKISYDLYDETLVSNFLYTDTTGGQRVAQCAYTGQLYNYSPPFTWTPSSPFSREHTFCHSWMPSYPSTNTFEYSDQHHLFLVNQNLANGVRSNHPLGKVETVISSYLDGKYGLNALGQLVYEPRDEQKGNSARALLYMSLRYNGFDNLDWTFSHLNASTLPELSEDIQDLTTLLEWHYYDMPDNAEMARNDYIQSGQQNRNPLIDHPYWVELIDFNSMTYIPVDTIVDTTNIVLLSIDKEINVFPNPYFNSSISGQISINGNSIVSVKIFTTYGQCIYSLINEDKDEIIKIKNLKISPGSYLLSCMTISGSTIIKKLIVN